MVLPSYVGRYEVRDEIAKGGFAVVVQAWDEELNSIVALKILHSELARDEAIQLRFLEEARLLRRVRSPNVITVHDVGRLDDGRPYFVMDFADRGTLAGRLKHRSGFTVPDPRSVMILVDALADGLSAIHEAGLVHRDIKPENVLLQLARRGAPDPNRTVATRPALVAADERILVGDLGIAKDLVKHGNAVTLLGGTPFYQAPEQADSGAAITEAADVYAATALLWHVLTGQRPPDVHEVSERLDGLPAAWHEVIGRGMALEPKARFTRIDNWRSAVQDAMAREAAETRGHRPADPVEATATCPYKGLEAYQPEDAHRFFGRDSLIDELVRRIRLQKVLVVGGPSGSGKSSLVRAGLIPALRAGALPGSENWRITLLTPGRDPLTELHFQVTRTLAPQVRAVPLEDLLARPTLARHLGREGESERPLVVVIDQFEEIFTLAPAAQRDAFIAALSAMTDPADSSVRIVIAVRADFYGACAQVPWLAERITDNQVLVGPMTGSELRLAISEPARRAGLYLERNLLDALIDGAGNEAGSLPLVAHALVETWKRRQGNMLTLEGFRAAGGVAGAISQTADTMFETRFNAAEQEAAKRLFLRLVTPGEGTPDTRRILAISEMERDSAPDVMRRVVEALTEARLLTVDDANVQIAHEALLRIWPRLRVWIEESRDDLRTRQRISRAAAEWEAEGRDSDLLYRGTPLLSALEWAARNPDGLGAPERAFLQASAEAKTQAELAAMQRVRRARRMRRAALAGLSFLAVGATLASIIAFLGFREARRNEALAQLMTVEAQERFAGALGSAARGVVDEDPLLALALAAEAVRRATAGPPGYDARASMIAARRVLARGDPFLVGSPIPAGDALAIALNPAADLVAVAQRDGNIDMIDTVSRQRTGPSLRGHYGGVEDVSFGPDGKWLASAGDDGTVRLWPVAGEPGPAKEMGKATNVLWNVRFSPSGSFLATAGDDAVHLWEVAEGAPNGELPVAGVEDFLSIAVSPDGSGVLAGNGDGNILGWSLPSREPLFPSPPHPHTSDVWGLAFSPMGNRFATSSSDGTSIVLEYPSGRIIGPAFRDVSKIEAIAFAPGGDILIGGDADGALRLWDINRNELVATTPRGHAQAIIDIEASRDGKVLATLGRDQLIRLWSLGTTYPLAEVKQVGGRSAKGVTFDRGGRFLAAGDDAGTVQVWEEGREDPLLLSGHRHQVWALAFSPDGSVLASGDRSGEVRLWDPATGALRRTIPGDGVAIWSVAFTPDGRRLIAASDNQVRSWDVTTGAPQNGWKHEGGSITRAVLSPDGTLLALAATDGKVRLLSLDRGTVVREIAVDDDVVWSVAFSPDGNVLAAASSDEVVALWEVATGRRRTALTGHVGGATDVAFLGDGATVVALDRSGKLHLWDADSGRSLSEAHQAHAGAAWRMSVHPDGMRFVTAGDDGLVKVWDELSVDRACGIGGPAFDAVRQSQYLGDRERSVACGGERPTR